jgi:ATP-dependent DNA helicase RecQ
LRGLWKLLAQQPSLGKLMHDDDELEAKLKPHLPGPPSNATIGAAIRILERHGMLGRDDQRLAAQRPQPGAFPTLDVASLQRRAEVERKKLRAMVDYAYNPRCRRQMVLEYFGDEDWTSRDRTCGACDNCDAVAHGRTTGMSEAEQTSARNVLMLVGALHGRFGRKRIAQLANGTDDDTRFADLPERSCVRGWSDKHVLDLLRALEGAGLVEASRGEYPTLATTKRGDLAAIGKLDLATLGIQMPTVQKRVRKRR